MILGVWMMERLIHCHRNILWCHHFWRSYLHPSVVLELKKSDMIKNTLKSQKGLVAIPIKRWISVRIQSAEFSIRLGRRQLLNWYSLVTNDIRGLNNPTGIPTNNFSCWSILQVKETFFPWGEEIGYCYVLRNLVKIRYGLFNCNAHLSVLLNA